MTGLRCALCVVMLAVPALTQAQAVRGTVLNRGDSAGVTGVVVLLTDSTGAVTGRALTDAAGEFRIVAPRAGSYRLRTLRVGFRPDTSDVVIVGAGQEGVRRFVLAGVPVQLDTVRVADRSTCHALSDGTYATATIWEQARAALQSAQLTARLRSVNATIVTWERTLDPNSERILQEDAGVVSGLTVRPWTTQPPERLHEEGYVVLAGDGTASYYAPDLDVLLSPGFVQDHCFRVARSRDTTLLGIAFEPTRERQDVAEIQGTLWLERRSAELRRLEFRYVNVPLERSDRARGEMDFVRMRNGSWAILRWGIRMPVLDHGFRTAGETRTRVVELRAVGGELSSAVHGTDTLFAGTPLVLTGTMRDSSSGAAVAGAALRVSGTTLEATTDSRGRFTLAGVLPGAYTIDVRAPAYDAINATVRWPIVVTEGRTQQHLRIPSVAEIAHARAATLMGVVQDSTGVPIAGADVALPRLGVLTITDERGAFKVGGIPPGEHDVVVRRMGYGPLNAVVAFPERQTVERRVMLSRLVVLDTVVVEAESPLPEFEVNRKLGLGRFLTRADLERLHGRPLSSTLSQTRGVGFVTGQSGRAYLTSTHAAPSLRVQQGWELAMRRQERDPYRFMRDNGFIPPHIYCPVDMLEAVSGLKCACYTQVWLDRTLMNPGDPTPPFDVNSIPTDMIEAVEYYSNPAQAPMRYQARNATCGVLVLHRRRSFDKQPAP